MIKQFIKRISKKLTEQVVELPRFPLIQINEESLSPEAKEVYEELLNKIVLHDATKSNAEYQNKYEGLFVNGSKREQHLEEKTMSIKRVTFSGIDEGIDPLWLAETSSIHSDCINIEWGILLSNKNGRPRYPGEEWIERLGKLSRKKELFLAGHLCGKYARDFVNGTLETNVDLDIFDRIQINFGPFIELVEAEKLYDSIAIQKQTDSHFILQAGKELDKTIEIARYLKKRLIQTSILFDCSGGNGIEQTEWPQSLPDILCGYAGGLGPHNLSQKLQDISSAAGAAQIWIDMESGIRTHDVTDQEKILDVINIIKQF